jgi:hypothetical protein
MILRTTTGRSAVTQGFGVKPTTFFIEHGTDPDNFGEG